jgi:hypothetical protein
VGGGEGCGLSQCAHGAPINFGDLNPNFAYVFQYARAFITVNCVLGRGKGGDETGVSLLMRDRRVKGVLCAHYSVSS